MNFSADKNELLFSKILNPFYQSELKSIKSILDSFNLEVTKDNILKFVYKLKLLPLSKDPLPQGRLLEIVSDLSTNGYREIAQGLLTLKKDDSNLCIEIKDSIFNASKS